MNLDETMKYEKWITHYFPLLTSENKAAVIASAISMNLVTSVSPSEVVLKELKPEVACALYHMIKDTEELKDVPQP